MAAKEGYRAVTVLLDGEVVAWLETSAKENFRSLAGHIRFLLEESKSIIREEVVEDLEK